MDTERAECVVFLLQRTVQTRKHTHTHTERARERAARQVQAGRQAANYFVACNDTRSKRKNARRGFSEELLFNLLRTRITRSSLFLSCSALSLSRSLSPHWSERNGTGHSFALVYSFVSLTLLLLAALRPRCCLPPLFLE